MKSRKPVDRRKAKLYRSGQRIRRQMAPKLWEYHCTRCPERDYARTDKTAPLRAAPPRNWMATYPPLVVQGVAIGVCVKCASRGELNPTGEVGASCDHTCKGKKPSEGFYYGTKTPDNSGESWCCWDWSCVNWWIENRADPCCYNCDTEYDFYIKKFVVKDGEHIFVENT